MDDDCNEVEHLMLANVRQYADAYEVSGNDPVEALTEALKGETIKSCREAQAKLDAKA